MAIIKAIFRIIIGAIFGVASSIALLPAIAAAMPIGGEDGSDSTWLVWVIIAIGAALGFFAPSIRRAFGRGFLVLGVSTFALPLSMMLLSGRVASETIAQGATDAERAGAALGASIAGTILTGAGAFIGFFLGTIFLITGLVLVLGGRREVVVVSQPAYAPDYSGVSTQGFQGQPDSSVINVEPDASQIVDRSKWSKQDREEAERRDAIGRPQL